MSRPPVVAAWGAGVDSTAMIVEMAENGEPIDMVLFADPGSEKAGTYAFIPLFRRWMADHGIPSEICRYQPRNFKHWPPYATIAENMLTNATLPSLVFNRGSCSQKWKASAQDAWTADWEPARRCWDAGNRVVKLIGYDASARDTQRYHHAIGCEDPRYAYRYPLREWGWDRARCEQRIAAAGLPIPPKSSCFFCGSIKPDEVEELSADELRIIVLMEARAKPRLRMWTGFGDARSWVVAERPRAPAASPSSSASAASFPRRRSTASSPGRRPSFSRFKRPRPPSPPTLAPRWDAGSTTSIAAPTRSARSTMVGPQSPSLPIAPATSDGAGAPVATPLRCRSDKALHRPMRILCTPSLRDHGRGGGPGRGVPSRHRARQRFEQLAEPLRAYPVLRRRARTCRRRRFLARYARGANASVLPVPGLFTDTARVAGYAATRSEDLVLQLRIMLDAIGDDGRLMIDPKALVRLCATGRTILEDIEAFGLPPKATRRGEDGAATAIASPGAG